MSSLSLRSPRLLVHRFLTSQPGARGLGFSLLVVLTLFLRPASVVASPGSVSRACGLDTNRNGVIGEPEDCRVCDGSTADPDFDSIEEDINYIDATAGVDGLACGAASSPCATLGWVLAGSNSSYPKRVDGAISDPEDIVCVKGRHILSGTQTITSSGAPGSYAANLYPGDSAAWGPARNESYRYASNPLMIVGWDADGDGSYPPFDRDDTATFVADPQDNQFIALRLDGDDVELAHLVFEDFGEGDTNGLHASGLLEVGPSVDFLYVHDLTLRDVNRLSRHHSGRNLVNLFSADGSSYLAFVNNSIERMAGYGFRGSCAGCTDVRVDHNTATVQAVNGASTAEPGVTFYRAWDSMDRVSVSYNDLNADPDLWTPSASDNVLAIAASICVQNMTVRGNRIVDFRDALRVRLTTTTGECQSRPIDGLTFDGNLVSQAYAGYAYDRALFVANGEGSSAMYLRNMTFSNNVIRNTVPMQDAMLVWGGSDSTDFTGTYRIVNNTIYGDFAGAAMAFENVGSHHANVVLENNLFQGTANRNVDFGYADATLTSDFNIWEATAEYRERSSYASDLNGWRNLGHDGQGAVCRPTFVDPPFDLHLDSSDRCAVDAGTELSGVSSSDIDEQARPGGCGWDVGADELPGGCGGGPSPGSLKLSATSYAGAEGQSVSISVQRVGGSDGAASARLAASSASATSGLDFAEVSRDLAWTDGDATPRTVSIQLFEDSLVEGAEQFALTLVEPVGAVLGSPATATVTVTDTTSPSAPGVASFDVTGLVGQEGETLSLTVVRSGGSDGAASVRVSTSSGSAISGLDFTPISQTLSWADGDASPRSLSIALSTDAEIEPPEELGIALTDPQGLSLGSPSAITARIEDTTPPANGVAGVAQFSSATFAGAEGSQLLVTVVRVGGSSGAASVGVLTQDGSALTGSDFAPVASTVSWVDGEDGAKPLVVEIYADTKVEPAETFGLTLVQATGVGLGSPSTASVTIEDATQEPTSSDLSSIQLDRGSLAVSEGRSARVKVRREGSSTGRVSVKYFTVEGSARAKSDFVADTGTLTWESGDTRQRQIVIDTVDDRLSEPPESFALVLGDPAGAAALGAIATSLITIEDDDTSASGPASDGVRFVATEPVVGEEDGHLELQVERVGSTGGPASIDVVVTAGTAQADRDFVPLAETLRWSSQQGGVIVLPIEILQDDLVENPESFTIELKNPWRTQVIGPSSTQATIFDDEILSSASVGVAADGEHPAIASHPENRLAVVWQSSEAAAPARLQLFDHLGQPTSVQVPLGSSGNNAQSPAAAFDRDGNLGLIWFEDSPVARRKVVVGSFGAGDQTASRPRQVLGGGTLAATDLGLAADGYGRFLLTWRDEGRIQVRSFDTSGSLQGASSLPAALHHRTDVALGGESIMVLELVQSIAFQRYDRAGNEVGALTPVTVDVTSRRPDVAAAADGRFALVWEADETDARTGSDVYAQLFDQQGLPEGPSFRVNTKTAGNQSHPRVDANDAGDFAVTWIDEEQDDRVMVRFFDSRGRPATGDLVVASSSELGRPSEPNIAIGNDDRTTIVYTREDTAGTRAVYFRRFDPELGVGECTESDQTLCLGAGRFRVHAIWRDSDGARRTGTGTRLTNDTGYFSFFDEDNVELVVKTLNGCGLNQRHWVFAGGLTDVEVLVQVDDTFTGDTRTYFARDGRSFAPIRDTKAFSECGPELPSRLTGQDPDTRATSSVDAPSGSGACAAESGLCLNESRFLVEASWQRGQTGGPAASVALTRDTGYFWFFEPDNVELVVKVLDACSVNGRYWVFTGGLTDVGVSLRVTDQITGETLDYSSPAGQPFAPILDTRGFSRACPVP